MVKKQTFNIGDIVTVQDFGMVYSHFQDMFHKFNFINKEYNNEKYQSSNKQYRVIGKTTHPWSNELMLAIESKTSQLIIDAKGCKLKRKICKNENIRIL